MKLVWRFCYMFLVGFFGPDRAQCSIYSIPIILNLLTSRNITLIYSLTI